MRRAILLGLPVTALMAALAFWLLRPEPPAQDAAQPAPAPPAETTPTTASGAEAAVDAAAGQRSVFIEVLSRDQPVTGARVVLRGPRSGRVDALTDTSGVAELRFGGISRVEVSARGYVLVEQDPRLPDVGDVSWSVSLKPSQEDRSDQRTRVRGVVLCEGQPHAGAAVALVVDPKSGRAVGVSRTDASGRFVVETEVALREIAAVQVLSRACGDASGAPATDRELVFELAGGGRVMVTVVDDEGTPLPRFRLRVRRMKEVPLLRQQRGRKLGPELAQARRSLDLSEAEVDDEGAVLAGPLAPGQYRVLALAEGREPADAVVEVAPGSVVRQTLVLGGVLTVRGTVTSGGKPVANAQVLAVVPNRQAGKYGVARTDARGHYEIQTRPRSRQTLVVTAKGHLRTDVSGVEGEAGETLERDVSLQRASAGARKNQKSYVGIGAVLRKKPEGVSVEKTMTGGPAEGTLEAGDLILEIDGDEVGDRSLRDVVERILGEIGTPVELVVRRGGDEVTVVLERAQMRGPS